MRGPRLIAMLAGLRERLDRRVTARQQRAILLGATLLFLGGGVLAWMQLDIGASELRPVPLVLVAVVGVPATAMVNAAEYVVSAVIVGQRARWADAMRVGVVGTAANMLPLPGAAAVRIRALRELGPGYRRATAATLVVGLGWIAVAAALAAGAVASAAEWRVAVGFAAVAGLTGTGAVMVLRRLVPPERSRSRLLLLVVAVEVASVLVGALRLMLVLEGLGMPGALAAGLVLAVSGSLSAAVGVLPGGLGVRELIAAGLAPLVALPAAAGFTASAVNRLIGMAVHAPLTLLLARGGGILGGRGEPPAPVPTQPGGQPVREDPDGAPDAP